MIATVGIEEKFDLVMENYVEYEQQLLALAMRYLAFRNPRLEAVYQERVAVTRRLVNLLSAARLYMDQLHHDVAALFGQNHDICIAIERVRSEQYHARLGYRLMETLRNSVQHRSLAGTSVTQNYGTDNSDANSTDDLMEKARKRRVVVRVIAVLNRSGLEDLELKATVKNEIIALQREQIDLTSYVRDYMDGLGAVHTEFRKQSQERRLSSELVITEALDSAKNRWPNLFSGGLAVKVVKLTTTGADSSYLAPPLLEYLQFLGAKNQGSPRLSNCYVSSRTDPA